MVSLYFSFVPDLPILSQSMEASWRPVFPPKKTAGPITDDQMLEQFGYRQELKRTLGYFSAFALSFSVISVTRDSSLTMGLGCRRADQRYLDLAHRGRRPVFGGPGVCATSQENTALWLRIPVDTPSGRRPVGMVGWLDHDRAVHRRHVGRLLCHGELSGSYLGLPNTGRNVVAITVAILFTISLINHYGSAWRPWLTTSRWARRYWGPSSLDLCCWRWR